MRPKTPKSSEGNVGDEVTTMRVRRRTLAKLAELQRELGASSLDEALEAILFRHRAYEAIARLKADPDGLADYQRESAEWAEVDAGVRE
jgi:hypothetical protein